MTEIRSPIEAILFVAESPITAQELAEVVEAPLSDVEETLAEIERELVDRRSGIVLRGVAGGWRFYTAADMLPYLERFAASERATRLSNAALETLAVVAYKQPASRAEIERIRGVGVGPILRHLLELDLVKVAGREEGLGRALLYATTRAFLDRFGLKSPKDLPASLEL